MLERHPGRFLWLFTAWYLVAEVCLNARRPFWFDELVAGSLANVPSIGQIWGLIERGIELNPPLTFWIQWVVAHTLGTGEVVSRLPAILGFWLMCVCLYHFVRRRTDAVSGFVALLFPLLTSSAEDATFARGYGMLLGSSAAALLSWQYAADGVHRARAVVLLSLATAVSVSTHYYALYVVGTIALGELVRTFALEGRRIGPMGKPVFDAAVWAALIVGVSPLAIYLPLVRRATAGAHTFWVQPEFRFIRDSYVDMLGGALILFLIWQWCALTRTPARDADARPVTAWPRHEAVACLALAAMPLVFGIFSQFLPVAFFPRYVQPVVIGGTIVLALFAHRASAMQPGMRQVTLGLLIGLGIVPWGVLQIGKAAMMPTPAQISTDRFRTFLSSDLPLVMDNYNEALRIYHYSPPDVRERLFLLKDEQGPLRFLGSDTMMRSLELMHSIEPVHLVDYHRFVAEHDHFLIALTNAESWIAQSLIANGTTLKLVAYEKGDGPFANELFIFRAEGTGFSAQRLGR